MQINSASLLRVIFLLSTIVYVTDCCSSRILLLKDHTLKVVHQHRLHALEHARRLEEEQRDHLMVEQLHMKGVAIHKNYTEKPPDESFASQFGAASTATMATTTTVESTDRGNSSSRSEDNGGAGGGGASSSDPKFDVLDYYYAIMRDVLTFECSGPMQTEFCLHGGRCFRYPVRNHSFFSCECADGYMGERCESKSLNGDYVATAASLIAKQQPKVAMARIVFSFPTLIALSAFYIVCGALIVFKRPNPYRAADEPACS